MNHFKNRKISFVSFLIVAFFLFACEQSLFAQDKIEISKHYQIKLVDGGTISGKVISVDEYQILVETSAMGSVTINRSDIKDLILLSDKDMGKGWFPNPNPSKYLIGNSAIPLEKGSGYYQNTWIFFNAFSYAFTDFFSLTGGFEIFSLLAEGEGEGIYAYYLNPKASFEVADNIYLGGNILYANTVKTTDDFGGLGTINAFGTYGNDNNNISVGVGWGFVESEFSSRPVITVSGMLRASRRVAFVTENWIVPVDNYYGIFSYGIRFMGEKTSIDLAFINNPDIASEIIIGIPFLDFVINF